MPNRQKRKIEFIKRAQEIHNTKYDYSQVDYINSNTKIKILCPVHGIFEQRPNGHISRKNGCPQCSIKKRSRAKRISTDKFFKRVNLIHNNKYDYSKSDYLNMTTKIKIGCSLHGDFLKSPSEHIYQKQGCPKCSFSTRSSRKKISTAEFSKKANHIHRGKYDYSKINFNSSLVRDKILIICPEHGEFCQKGNDHLRGHGCPRCTNWYYIKDTPTILYYIKYKNLYKIGITTKSLNERFGVMYSKIDIIKIFEYPTGQEAYNEEQLILSKYRSSSTICKDFLSIGGSTEFFTEDILRLINTSETT